MSDRERNKKQFSKISTENIIGPIQCQNKNDTQAHMLNCEEVIKVLAEIIGKKLTSDIFGNTLEQSKVVKSSQRLMRVRERLPEEFQGPACHGKSSGP